MTAPLNPSIPDRLAETLADVRAAMNRQDDFDPSPDSCARGEAVFEILAAREALTIDDQVLA